jgi:polysaccharide biosynthesis/export protein VpsN
MYVQLSRLLSFIGFALVMSMAFAMAAPQTTPNSANVTTTAQKRIVFDYQLAPGDTISVVVFGETELSKEYTVGESGRIAFPLLGGVEVIGLKTKQIEKLLVQKLKAGFLVNPKVNVSIRSYRAVYVNGQVRSPNGYPFVPGMTVRKLISIAGGFTERASQSRIFVISDNAGANASPRKVKLDAEVRPGDIISVEESFF